MSLIQIIQLHLLSKPDLTSDSKQTFILLMFCLGIVFVCLHLCLKGYEDEPGKGEREGTGERDRG